MKKYTKSNIRRRKTLKRGGGIPNKNSFPNFINKLIYFDLGVDDSDNFSSLYDFSIKNVDEIKQKYDILKQKYNNDTKIDKYNDKEYQTIFHEIYELNSDIFLEFMNDLFKKFYGNLTNENIEEEDFTQKKIMNYFGLYDDNNPIIDALYEKDIMYEGLLFLPKDTI